MEAFWTIWIIQMVICAVVCQVIYDKGCSFLLGIGFGVFGVIVAAILSLNPNYIAEKKIRDEELAELRKQEQFDDDQRLADEYIRYQDAREADEKARKKKDKKEIFEFIFEHLAAFDMEYSFKIYNGKKAYTWKKKTGFREVAISLHRNDLYYGVKLIKDGSMKTFIVNDATKDKLIDFIEWSKDNISKKQNEQN